MTEPSAGDGGRAPAGPRDVTPSPPGGGGGGVESGPVTAGTSGEVSPGAVPAPDQPGRWGGPITPGGAVLPGQPTPSNESGQPGPWSQPGPAGQPGQPGSWSQPDQPAQAGQPGSLEQPHCYRHPERETYVSCQRCGRPICPDCMRPAAVGFHCPEESGGGSGRAGSARPGSRSRPGFGSRVGRGRQGLVTQVLMGLCAVAYVLQGLPGLDRSGNNLNQFSLDFLLSGVDIAFYDQYYRFVAAAFLHGNFLHILVNLYALFIMGHQLEAVVGRLRLIGLFLAGAVGGNVLSYVVNGLETSSLGASTAIFGFFGAFYVIARRMRADTTQILILIVLNFAITFSLSSIDRWGHIGGLVAGTIVGAIYAYMPARRGGAEAAAVLTLIGVLFAAAVVKTSSLGLPV
ncbi:rhomboid family intramembrane serine protease [Parafrankia sp. EUN1f]|uniref:rhomboid family intramembrane serine protease n=1 Tax=Parafrankia sp. EUN1f TaxID=102897 RepID=UPI001E30DE0C|nr:rhomboid family intramembrane serine protease [Parafrankia sp. EUN1f]